MKNVLFAAAVATLVGYAAPSAIGQVLTSGESGLIVGFDFANVPNSGSGSFVSNTFTNAGLYSDVGTGDDSLPGTYVPRGTLYMDGTHFSDTWNKFTVSSGGSVVTGDFTSNNEIDSDLALRHGVAGKSFDGYPTTGAVGEIGGEATAYVPKQLAIRTNNTAALNNISFTIDTSNFANLKLSYGAKIVNAGGTGSVLWQFTTDGSTFIDLGTDILTGADTKYVHDLVAFSQLNNLATGTYVATFTSNASTTQFGLDNLQWTGTYITASAAPVITSSLAASGTVGTPFSYTITASNTPTSFGATGLPSWASVNTTTGAITGTPDAIAVTNVGISATNGTGTDNQTLVLTINAGSTAPSFALHPADVTKLAGENATFTVLASGSPTPTYQWQRSTDGGTVWANLTNDATFSGATTVMLTVTSVTAPMNNHRFRAIATNGVAPDATSNAAILTVNVAPSVPTPPANTTKTSGENAAFTVVVDGQPTPTLQWQRSTDAGVNFNNLSNDATFSGVTTATLTITSVTVAMNDHRFRAIATNGVDPDATSAAAILTVNPGAPVIDSPTTTNGAVGISFSYTITATDSPTSFGATNLPSWATLNPTTGAITGTPDAAAVTTVNISATNGTGTGNGQVEITITATLPPAPVINSSTTATGTLGASFTYTITATNNPTSFGATGLPSWASVNTATGAITGTPDAAAVTAVSISATNAGGTGNGQVQITIQTSVPAAPAQPTGAVTSYNSFTAQWTAVAGATGYRLDVATDAAFTQFVTGFQNLDVGNVTSKEVTGLPLGKYYFRVRAYNGSGTSLSSAAQSVDVGSRLTNLSTRGLTSNASPMVGGFYVSGAPKTVLIRAAAKILADLGVAGTVPNPRLRLVSQATGLDIAINNDWDATDPVVIDAIQKSGAGLVFTPGSVDSALIAQNLAPGGYTAIVETVTGASGIVLLELYEIDEIGRLANISTRGVTVESGSNVMIPGTFFGPTSKKLLIRVVGETLGNFLPPATVLTDPVLEIYDQGAPNAPMLTIDDWDVNDAALKATWTPGDPNQVAGLAFAPAGTKDAAVLVVLPANTHGYTVIARGKNGASGNVLVEIYEAR